ncbi:MAG: hypothetical protein ACI4WU_04455 [Bacilli bacterium]
MENKKGSGIFLGVVSVATLIVAIIGATFAYFSTQTQSTEDAVNVTAYEFATTVTSVERIYPTTDALTGLAGQGIIPLNANATVTGGDTTNLLYAVNNKSCVDDRGYMVCALYKVTLTNGSVSDAELNLSIKTTANNAGSGTSKFTDLTFQALNGTEGTLTTFGLATTLSEDNGTTVDVNENETTAITLTVPGSNTLEHYFVVYLNEATEETDQSTQMGATYTGQLIYTTTTGGNRLTGTFTIGG